MKIKRLLVIFCLALFILYGCNQTIEELGVESVDAVEFEYDRVVIAENADTGYVALFLSVYAREEVEVTIGAVKKADAADWAIEDTNFILPVKKIIIPKGVSSVRIPVIPINDTIVNKNRQFDLRIQAVKGAFKSNLSQTCRIIFENEDKWPEISFPSAFTLTTEHDNRLVVPVYASGTFYNPAMVTFKVAGNTAIEGQDFKIEGENRTFVFDEEHKKDSIVIHILSGEIAEDIHFDLTLDVDIQRGAVTGKYKNTQVVIKNVVKTIGFPSNEIALLKGIKIIRVPVYVQGVSSPKELTATVSIESYSGGLNIGDIMLPNPLISTKGNDTVYLELTTKPGFALANNHSIKLKLNEVVGGTITDGLGTCSVTVKDAPELSRDNWKIVSCSSSSGTGESAEKIIDNDPATFWQSKWSNPAEGEELPYTIVIDMHEIADVEALEINRNNDYMKRLTMFVSEDNVNWISMGKCEFTDNVHKFELPELFTGRYLKIFIEESTNVNKAVRIGELKAFGQKHDKY